MISQPLPMYLSPHPSLSQMKIGFLVAGFSLAFGALFSKTWRVYQIFTNIKMGKKPVKDGQLMIFIVSLLFINVAVLVIWELIDPRRISVVEVGMEEFGDFTIITRIEECRSDHQIIFTGILLAIQCLLML